MSDLVPVRDPRTGIELEVSRAWIEQWPDDFEEIDVQQPERGPESSDQGDRSRRPDPGPHEAHMSDRFHSSAFNGG